MPKIIRDGAVVEDDWRGRLLDLESYNEALAGGDAPAPDIGVVLEPDQPPSELGGNLNAIPLIAINFPVFTDGRGFSYARELRQRARYSRPSSASSTGFNAFDFAENTNLDAAISSLWSFSEHYQADVLQPEPLFRRR